MEITRAGVAKAKVCKETYGAKLEFPEGVRGVCVCVGGGEDKKSFRGRGRYGYFLEPYINITCKEILQESSIVQGYRSYFAILESCKTSQIPKNLLRY